MALAGALANMLCAVTGITNQSLRALMTGLPGAPYSMNQASYDLARLSRNGLTTRIPRRNLHALTADGLRSAIFCTKVHDRVLRPLMAGGQLQVPSGPSSRGRRARRHYRQSGCRTGLAGSAGSRAARCLRARGRHGGSSRIARCRG